MNGPISTIRLYFPGKRAKVCTLYTLKLKAIAKNSANLANLDDNVLLHLQGFRGLVIVDVAAVEEETEGCHQDFYLVMRRIICEG